MKKVISFAMSMMLGASLLYGCTFWHSEYISAI